MPRSSNGDVSASYRQPKPGGDASRSSWVVSTDVRVLRVSQLDEVELVDGLERVRKAGRQWVLDDCHGEAPDGRTIEEERTERVVVRLTNHHPPRSTIALDAARSAPTRSVQRQPTTSGLQPRAQLSVVLLGWHRSRDVRHEQTGRGAASLEVGVVGRDGRATVIQRGQLVRGGASGRSPCRGRPDFRSGSHPRRDGRLTVFASWPFRRRSMAARRRHDGAPVVTGQRQGGGQSMGFLHIDHVGIVAYRSSRPRRSSVTRSGWSSTCPGRSGRRASTSLPRDLQLLLPCRRRRDPSRGARSRTTVRPRYGSPARPARAGPASFCFACEDVHAEAERLVANGLEEVDLPRRADRRRNVAFFDPRSTGGILTELVPAAAELVDTPRVHRSH